MDQPDRREVPGVSVCIAIAVKHMLAAGMAHDAIVAAVAEMETQYVREDDQPKLTPRQERNRRYYEKRLKASEKVLNEDASDDLSLETKGFPKPLLKTQILSTPSPPKGGSVPKPKSDFDLFWLDYPRKVGKRKAMLAYASARKRGVDPGEILAGLANCAMAWATDSPEFIPHPQTWLNRDGWLDQLTPRQGRTNATSFRQADAERARANVERRHRAADSLVGLYDG